MSPRQTRSFSERRESRAIVAKILADHRSQELFPAPIIEERGDPDRKAAALARSAEIRAGVRAYLATITDRSPHHSRPVG